jgi:hypothetical protein
LRLSLRPSFPQKIAAIGVQLQACEARSEQAIGAARGMADMLAGLCAAATGMKAVAETTLDGYVGCEGERGGVAGVTDVADVVGCNVTLCGVVCHDIMD